ncbi:CXAR protein, partial [Polypterus senegalus]
MDCKFKTTSDDIGQLGIEWVLLPPDVQSKDTMLLMYSAGMVYDQYYGPVIGRIHLSSQDPASGDASVELTNLKPTDSGTYQCRVKKIPGNGNRKITLNVIVKPSTPRCYIEGTPENTRDITLKCLSSEGTTPMSYLWSKITDTKTLPQNAVLAKNTSGVIAGAIIGTLLALLALAIILICWYRTRNKKKYEKEISHEIKEDVPPPKSRASTARSFASVGSNRSSLGSMSPSNLHEYSLKPHYDKIPSEEYERPPSQAPNLPSAKVAGPNLSRMGAVPVMIPAQSRDGSILSPSSTTLTLTHLDEAEWLLLFETPEYFQCQDMAQKKNFWVTWKPNKVGIAVPCSVPWRHPSNPTRLPHGATVPSKPCGLPYW